MLEAQAAARALGGFNVRFGNYHSQLLLALFNRLFPI
jgi:hypothetical protein